MSQLSELIRSLKVFRFFQRSQTEETPIKASSTDDSASANSKARSSNKPHQTGQSSRGIQFEHADWDPLDFDLENSQTEADRKILSQSQTGDAAQADETAPPRRRLPLGVSAGVLALAAIALWWSWPLWAGAERPFVLPTLETVLEQTGIENAASEAEAAARIGLQGLAIVNPDNLPTTAPTPLPAIVETDEAGTDEAGTGETVDATVDTTQDIEPQAVAQASDDPATTEQPTGPDQGEEAESAAPPATEDAPSQSGESGTGESDSAESDSAVSDTTESEPESTDHAPDLDEGEPAQAAHAAQETEENFPEVGQSDTDSLSPFSVDVEIPTPAITTAQGTLPSPDSNVVQTVAGQNNGNPTTGAQPDLILLPTATPQPDTQRLQSQASNLPRVEIIPAVGVRNTPTPEPSPTITPTPTPTPIPSTSGRGRLWSTFTPNPAPANDHYWIGNPFAGISANRSASPSYQFGSTAGNRYRPHHGIDISNPTGTPVRSGVMGQVVHAGPDDPQLLGPYNNFYGNTVVILLDQRLPVAGGELDVFVLYAHLSEVRTEVGERVTPDDIIGLVGMTGIAIGPHLHVEVRLGGNTYDHSVNPYLWLEPPANSGTVAVRILTADGHTWAGAKVSIARFDGGAAIWARQIETYLDTENIGPDPAWGENGAMGDVPAGTYYLIANIEGENIRREFVVNPGETTFIEVRTQQ